MTTEFMYTYIKVAVALANSSVTVSYSSFVNEEVCCYKFQQVWIFFPSGKISSANQL